MTSFTKTTTAAAEALSLKHVLQAVDRCAVKVSNNTTGHNTNFYMTNSFTDDGSERASSIDFDQFSLLFRLLLCCDCACVCLFQNAHPRIIATVQEQLSTSFSHNGFPLNILCSIISLDDRRHRFDLEVVQRGHTVIVHVHIKITKDVFDLT